MGKGGEGRRRGRIQVKRRLTCSHLFFEQAPKPAPLPHSMLRGRLREMHRRVGARRVQRQELVEGTGPGVAVGEEPGNTE